MFFVNQAIVQAATTRPYSRTANLISDLGITACGPFSNGAYHVNVCSPLHGLMDGTFVVVGLLQILGAITTRRAWPREAYPVLFLLVLADAGLALAGLAPENINLGLPYRSWKCSLGHWRSLDTQVRKHYLTVRGD